MRTLRQGEDGLSIYVEDDRGYVVADVRMPDPIPGEGVVENMRRHRALASCFAAAPEMLEALKEMARIELDMQSFDGIDGKIVSDARKRRDAVIAKAEGRE